jgi:hypothetical protein
MSKVGHARALEVNGFDLLRRPVRLGSSAHVALVFRALIAVRFTRSGFDDVVYGVAIVDFDKASAVVHGRQLSDKKRDGTQNSDPLASAVDNAPPVDHQLRDKLPALGASGGYAPATALEQGLILPTL